MIAEQIQLDICDRIASGQPIRKVCKELGIGSETIYKTIASDDEFAKRYARAKEKQAEVIAEEILEISDDATNDFEVDEEGNSVVNQENIQRSRLRVDSRKWILSKLLPKKYGDRTALDLANQDGKTLKIEVTRVPGSAE